jgi:hypothetical protein
MCSHPRMLAHFGSVGDRSSTHVQHGQFGPGQAADGSDPLGSPLTQTQPRLDERSNPVDPSVRFTWPLGGGRLAKTRQRVPPSIYRVGDVAIKPTASDSVRVRPITSLRR